MQDADKKHQQGGVLEEMTPRKAVRLFCLDCVGGSQAEVKKCRGDVCLNGGTNQIGKCLFYAHRAGKGRVSVKTIRKMCLFCMCGDVKEVRECHASPDQSGFGCPLHPYRMGKNPKLKGKRRNNLLTFNCSSRRAKAEPSEAHSQTA